MKAAEGPTIHQSVVTMLLARSTGSISVEFRNWTWFKKQLDSHSLLSSLLDMTKTCTSRSTTILFMSSTLTQWPGGVSPSEIYEKLTRIADVHGNLRLYPNRSELNRAHHKVGDIRALDMIADDSEHVFSFRPRTCFGTGPCTLAHLDQSERMVLKRAYSCGAADVVITDPSDRNSLLCTLSDQEPSTDFNEQLWFHQEYVASLHTLGEFRVFIKSQTPISSRKNGYIICAAKSRVDWDTKGFATRQVNIVDDFGWSYDGNDVNLKKEAANSKYKEMCDFAIHVYSKLRQRHDADECYESLEIGVRLDIGVSQLCPEGRFFVNEITRWYAADFFSSLVLPQPHIAICRAYAEGLTEYFTTVKL